MIIELVICGT